MNEELFVEKQDFAIIKDKIIKTNELLLLFNKKNEKLGNATVAFKHLKSKYENTLQELNRLKLDNERLTDTIGRLKPLHEQTITELKELKLDYSKLEDCYQQHLIKSQLTTTELEEKLKQCICEANLLTSPTGRKNADHKIQELKLKCRELKDEQHKLKAQNNSLIKKNKALEEKNNKKTTLQKKLDDLQVELQNAKEGHSALQNTIESLQKKHVNEVDILRKEISTLSLEKRTLLPLRAECEALKVQISKAGCGCSRSHKVSVKSTQTTVETKQDFSVQTEAEYIESTSRNKCHVFTQTEIICNGNILENPICPTDLEKQPLTFDINMGHKTDEANGDLSDFDRSLADIFSEMIMPEIMSPMSQSPRPAESPSPLPVMETITSLDHYLSYKQAISLNTLPNIIITPPTPNVENNSSSKVQFPVFTRIPEALLKEDKQNAQKIGENSNSSEVFPCLESEGTSINTQGDFKEGLSLYGSVNSIIKPSDEITLPSDASKESFGEKDIFSTKALSNNVSVSSEKRNSSVPNLDQSVATDSTSKKEVVDNSLGSQEKMEKSLPTIRILDNNVCPNTQDDNILLNKLEEKFAKRSFQRRRKFWMPFGVNMFVKSKRNRPAKVTKKCNKKDTILDVLRALQQNNINFTISNSSFSLNDNGGYQAKPELVIQPENCKNTFSYKLSCLDKKCSKNNNSMMLRKCSYSEEPELLGFFSAKPELKAPATVEEPSKDSHIQDLVQQLLHGLKKLTGSKRKQKKSRNRQSEFNSETESELERLFRKSADVLGRNRMLLAVAKEQSLGESGSESEAMVDSGLVTAASKDTDSLTSFFSQNENGMRTPVEKASVDLKPSFSTAPEFPLRSFEAPSRQESSDLRKVIGKSLDYKIPFCPSLVSPLKSSPGDSSKEEDAMSSFASNPLQPLEENLATSFPVSIRPSLCQKISFDSLDNDSQFGLGGSPEKDRVKNCLQNSSFSDQLPKVEFGSWAQNEVLNLDLSIKTSDLNCTLDDINISQLVDSPIDDKVECAKDDLKKKRALKRKSTDDCNGCTNKQPDVTPKETKMALRNRNRTGTKGRQSAPSMELRSGRCLTACREPACKKRLSSSGTNEEPPGETTSNSIHEQHPLGSKDSSVSAFKSPPPLPKHFSKKNFEEFKKKYNLRQTRISQTSNDKPEIKLDSPSKLITIDRSEDGKHQLNEYSNGDFHRLVNEGENRNVTQGIQSIFKDLGGGETTKMESDVQNDAVKRKIQPPRGSKQVQGIKEQVLPCNKSVGANGNNKVTIIQDILITNGKTVNLLTKSAAPPAATYSRKKQRLEVQTTSRNSDILSDLMEAMTKTRSKASTTKAPAPRKVDLPLRNRTEQDSKVQEQDPFRDCPGSPDIVEVPDRLPRLIPTEKPTKMQPSKVLRLMDKLMVFSSEPQVLDEVIREFAFQDVDFMVDVVIAKLSCDIYDKPDNTFAPIPPMTSTQRILLGFLAKLDRSTHPGILDKFLIATEKTLLSKLTCNLSILQPLTRLYTAVCRMRLDLNRMRRFTCECFYFTGDFAVPILFTILTMWPNVLPMESETTMYPMGKVIVQLCYLKLCNQPGYNLLPLRDLLHKFYGYPTERWSCGEVFQEILVEYIRNPSVRLSDFTLLLFLKNKPAKWVYQKVKETIIPLFQFIPDGNPNLKATMLILLGNICASFSRYDEFEGSLISEMDDWFQRLQKVEKDPIVQSGLRLARTRLPKKIRQRTPRVKTTVQSDDVSIKPTEESRTEFNVSDDLRLSDSSLEEDDDDDDNYVDDVHTNKVTDANVDSASKQSNSSDSCWSDDEDMEIDLEQGCDPVNNVENSESISLVSGQSGSNLDIGVHLTLDKNDSRGESDYSDIEF